MSSDENNVNDQAESGSVPPFPGGQSPAQPEPPVPAPAPAPFPAQAQPPSAPQFPAQAQPPAAPSFGQQYPPQQPAPYPPQQPAPYAPQAPAAYPPQAQSPFPPQSPKPKRKIGVGVIIAIAGGSLVVLIGIIVAIAVGISSLRGGGTPAEPDAGGGSGGAATASDTVVGYLTAIADSDAETALGFLSSPPETTTALTDEVLEASNELAPITAIEVVDESGSSGTADVTVSYLLGDTPITATFGALDYDDDSVWEVTGGTASISTSSYDGLGLTINGQEVDGEFVDLFPGSYQLGLTQPNFALSNEGTFTVTEPFASVDTYEIRPILSEAGLQTFRSLVRADVESCIASTTLAAGCGLELPATISDGTQLTDGTISRTLSADQNATLDSLEATPSFDNPTLVEGDFIGSPTVEADCVKNGSSGRCSIVFSPSFGTPSVDMAAESPVVVWE